MYDQFPRGAMNKHVSKLPATRAAPLGIHVSTTIKHGGLPNRETASSSTRRGMYDLESVVRVVKLLQ